MSISVNHKALIALERGRRDVAVLVAEARRMNTEVTVPAGCVAQAWRDPRRQARVASFPRQPNVTIATLDAEEARRIGLLLAASGTTDVVDAHIALCAHRLGQTVLTSDADDIRRISPKVRTYPV